MVTRARAAVLVLAAAIAAASFAGWHWGHGNAAAPKAGWAWGEDGAAIWNDE